MGKTKYEAMEEELIRGWREIQRELPREKRERTYFAMKQSESLNEWIARINHDLDNGKRPKEAWEVGPDWDGEDDE